MVPVSPNIRRKTHAECWRQDWDTAWGYRRLGNVRRCSHGKIQVLTAPAPYSTIVGPGTWFWYTLSPILDPFRYRRAKRALEAK